MCKLFLVLDIENQNNVEHFMKKAFPLVTKHDNHGMGLMRLGENGVYVQRWLDIPKHLGDTKPSVDSPYLKALRIESNEYGVRSKRLDAIALHGRQATCGISLENTHPFVSQGTALMHNGIILNSTVTDNKVSSCDSEALLWRYLDHGIKENIDNLTEALSDLQGYYATIVFNNSGVVDVWVDDHATLYLASVQGIGTVIATTKELILQTAKLTNKKVRYIYPILSFTSLRWEPGKPVKIGTFTKPCEVKSITTWPQDKTVTQSEHWWKDYDKWDEEQMQHIRSIKGV